MSASTSTPQIKESCIIEDIRDIGEFKGITFSGFKNTEVRTQLLQNMIRGRIEHACYWCAELICSGHYLDAWENIFHFMAKHIHLGNPKMAIYVDNRFTIFRNIVNEGGYGNVLHLRNNPDIRRLFAEVICNLSLSPKKPSFETAKIQRDCEFDITQINDRIKAPTRDYARDIFQRKDPQELFIAVNEFAYQLAARNMSMCCYWIEWVIEFDAICKSRKQPIRCEARDYVDDRKYKCDIIWMLWDVIMAHSNARADPFIRRVLDSLLNIFKVKYTTSIAKKRRYVLYFAVELFTEHIVPSNTEIVADKAVLCNVVDKIDNVYKQIKKNEQRGNTDYLLEGVRGAPTMEQALAAMDMWSEIDNSRR